MGLVENYPANPRDRPQYPIRRVTLQSRVARRYDWRCEVKAKRFLGLGVRAVRLES